MEPCSFTDDPKQAGAPLGWTLTISEVSLSAGAALADPAFRFSYNRRTRGVPD